MTWRLQSAAFLTGHLQLPGGPAESNWSGPSENARMWCDATGLANVHPTWARTFVLAGMVALYPNIHFALIDNDCLPLTLCEIAELWHLASPDRVPLGSHPILTVEGHLEWKVKAVHSLLTTPTKCTHRPKSSCTTTSRCDSFDRASFRTECWPCRCLCLKTLTHCGSQSLGCATDDGC